MSSKNSLEVLTIQVKDDGQILLKHTLSGHQKPILGTSWSPDDTQILTCGVEEVIRRWDVNTGECLNIYERVGVGLISCGWFPDGKGIVSGMADKSICLWHLDGRELECWKGQRTLEISDMAITDDGKWIISICRASEILFFDREAKVERTITEKDFVTSFSLSKDNKYLLVNLLSQEIHLWNIEENPKIISTFKGHKSSRFIIRSCFGGFEQTFIASGSEDSQVLFSMLFSEDGRVVSSFFFIFEKEIGKRKMEDTFRFLSLIYSRIRVSFPYSSQIGFGV